MNKASRKSYQTTTLDSPLNRLVGTGSWLGMTAPVSTLLQTALGARRCFTSVSAL
ncbi:MAG: hypothetical protein WBH20_08215 [Oceanisphaera sp.]|uniref:hypothetical protein n=1 Tax=Oceanisphaera sp. TaxID=1929979 RepID=UPI003C756826